jgi:CarD family transcriptional regulator
MTTKKTSARQGFKTGEHIVYPAHGVGQITSIDEQEIAGFKLELFVIFFPKIASVGMRKLSDQHTVNQALDVLTGRARIKRTMWSRRAQEYEAKINSGDIISTAEVVRDLYRSEAQPEQSYSERQLYEAALARLVDEVAAVEEITETEAQKRIETSLNKNPRRAKSAEAIEEAGDADLEDEAA